MESGSGFAPSTAIRGSEEVLQVSPALSGEEHRSPPIASPGKELQIFGDVSLGGICRTYTREGETAPQGRELTDATFNGK